MKRLVVIGGTFNPPTIAHIRLAELAKKAAHGQQVLFIPAKTSFLKEWKGLSPADSFPEECRVHMLALALKGHSDMCLDTCEIDGRVSGKTIDTLNWVKKNYRPDEVFLAIGSDKLPELYSWYQAEKLLSGCRFLVMRRNYEPVTEILERDPFLKRYRDHFTLCDTDESMEEISATRIREAIKNGTLSSVKPYLNREVYHYIKQWRGAKKG